MSHPTAYYDYLYEFLATGPILSQFRQRLQNACRYANPDLGDKKACDWPMGLPLMVPTLPQAAFPTRPLFGPGMTTIVPSLQNGGNPKERKSAGTLVYFSQGDFDMASSLPTKEGLEGLQAVTGLEGDVWSDGATYFGWDNRKLPKGFTVKVDGFGNYQIMMPHKRKLPNGYRVRGDEQKTLGPYRDCGPITKVFWFFLMMA